MVESSVAITKSNIFSQVHANIFNLINNRSNVADPNDETGKRKFVYTREPNYMARNFAGYPLIIIPDAEYGQGKKTADASAAFVTDVIDIIIENQDKISDNTGDPRGRQTVYQIANSVIEVLNDKSNSATLRNNGLRHLNPVSTDFEFAEIDDQPSFRRTISLIFDQLRTIA